MKKVTLALVALCLASCAATVPIAPKVIDESAKLFVAPPDRSVVYIERENAYKGKAILFQVGMDGKMLGGIAAGTFYAETVAPGEHVITALSNENQDSLRLSTEPGLTYFVKVEPRWGMVSARVSLKQTDATEGKRIASSSSLAAGLGR
ncbi:MAG TPA: DUF2846 domain-containing protein [Thermoanaerobaculia bacterium]|jgi:hypothetical protein|nr:DUF2846 domain-containing protein [Thermoanaerobaculia bacterium]